MMFKRLLVLPALLTLAMLILGCSGATDPIGPSGETVLPERNTAAEGHYVWDMFSVAFNPDDGTAFIVPKREMVFHANVTKYTKPPACYDCVQIVGGDYLPAQQEWHITIQLKNNTPLAARNVRGLVYNLGNKYIKNPDGFMNIYLSQDMSFKEFAKADPVRAFWPGFTNQETYVFHFPPGGSWTSVDYIIDASWPGNCKEPIVENVVFPESLNAGVDHATMRVTAFDQQNEFFIVTADLSSIGGGLTPLFDDGASDDGDAGDGVYGAPDIVALVGEGDYVINIYTQDESLHYGWNSTRVHVVAGANAPPVIDEITMSHTTCFKGSVDDRITLECVAHDPNPGDVLQYEWSATGGQLGSQTGPTTTWDPPNSVGKFYVTCKVSDPMGEYDQEQSEKIRVTSYESNGEALAFSCERIIGTGTLTLSEYSPGNVILLVFWGTG